MAGLTIRFPTQSRPVIPSAMPFINPAFLLAAAALAIPLWLHLSRRRKYKEVTVGTLRFIRQAVKERKRRLRVEELPLLIARIAAVVLAAILFARPFLSGSEKMAEKESATIILLDASGSITPAMAEAARDAAADALSAAKGQVVKIAQFADEVAPLDSVKAYKPIAGAATRLDAALGWALDQFSTNGGKAGRVVLISHLAAGALPTAVPHVWPPQIAVQIVPLVPENVDNAAVRRVSLLTPYASEQMEIEALVSLPRDVVSRTVTLEAEGVHEAVVVPPGVERVVFRFTPPSAEVRGWVSVASGDLWPSDDRRPFVAKWQESSRILLVDGQPGSTPFEGQAFFIGKALGASGAAHGKSPFKPEIVFALEGNNGPVDLTGVKVIALCGVTQLLPGEVRMLAEFVANGGGLVHFLNGKWTRGATESLAQEGIFPESLSYTESTVNRPLSSWDREHPALVSFDGRDGGDLRSLEWRDAFDLGTNAGWRTLATLDGGHALMVQKSGVEKAGNIIVCAHPLTREWTDIPRELLFVPLVKNMFATLGGVAQSTPEARVFTPGLKEPRAIGHYGAEVVAADGRESLPAAVGDAPFRAAFGLPTTELSASLPPPQSERVSEHSREGELWPWLVVGLLLLLIAENFLATKRQSIPAAVTS